MISPASLAAIHKLENEFHLQKSDINSPKVKEKPELKPERSPLPRHPFRLPFRAACVLPLRLGFDTLRLCNNSIFEILV